MRTVKTMQSCLLYEVCFEYNIIKSLKAHLKLGPVHLHAGAVVVAEPLQIVLRVDSEDAALQLTVN